jgi:hypothetical protein
MSHRIYTLNSIGLVRNSDSERHRACRALRNDVRLRAAARRGWLWRFRIYTAHYVAFVWSATTTAPAAAAATGIRGCCCSATAASVPVWKLECPWFWKSPTICGTARSRIVWTIRQRLAVYTKRSSASFWDYVLCGFVKRAYVWTFSGNSSASLWHVNCSLSHRKCNSGPSRTAEPVWRPVDNKHQPFWDH